MMKMESIHQHYKEQLSHSPVAVAADKLTTNTATNNFIILLILWADF